MESPSAAVAQAKPFRILVCDDQSDVLEALRLLLKGQGYQAVTVDSPHALLRTARSETFDLILADLNYTRDTTSGEEGSRPPRQPRRTGQCYSCGGDDGVG